MKKPTKKTKKPAGRPKKSNCAETLPTRTRLLHAGVKLFAAKGLEGTTVRDIAEEAGVNLALISHYFEGKEGLHRACVEDVLRYDLERSERLLKPAASAEEYRLRFGIFIESFSTDAAAHPAVMQFLHREGLSEDPERREFFFASARTVIQRFDEYIQSGIARGFIRPGMDGKLLTSLVINLIFTSCRPDSASVSVCGKTIQDPDFRQGLVDFCSQWLFTGIGA